MLTQACKLQSSPVARLWRGDVATEIICKPKIDSFNNYNKKVVGRSTGSIAEWITD